jgi:hypothetical protein
MFFGVDQRAFFLGAGAPEQKNDVLALSVDGADNGVGELLQPLPLCEPGLAFRPVRVAFSSNTLCAARPVRSPWGIWMPQLRSISL